MSSSHFDEIAAVYDESLPAHVVEHYLRKRTAFAVRICHGGRVLDVGCGTGALAARLADRGYEVVGIDPSQGMLDVMRTRHPEIKAVQADGTALPFDTASFDLVLTVAALHHVAEPAAIRQTLAEMTRVCRPQGRILVWDHNPENPYWSSLMARVPQDTGEERLVPQQEIVEGLSAAGARVLSVQQLGLVPDFTPPRAIRAAAALERAFERTPYFRRYGAHNVIVATKPPGRDSSGAPSAHARVDAHQRGLDAGDAVQRGQTVGGGEPGRDRVDRP
ncbi:MAG: class I SAM-dependent methyltransferase [Solirubrobacteraceae bacterium]